MGGVRNLKGAERTSEGERASAGRGCSERGTLNASTVENPIWSYEQFALLGGERDEAHWAEINRLLCEDCGHLALLRSQCYHFTKIMSDSAYLVLKLLGSLVAAVAGVVGTVSDLHVVKDGRTVLKKGGYAVIACLILGTLVSMTTDYHKELSDRSAAQVQLDKLSTLVDEAGVTNSRLQGTNTDLKTQVAKSQTISDQLSDTEKKVDAASNRNLDPFSPDIQVRVEIWIPTSP